MLFHLFNLLNIILLYFYLLAKYTYLSISIGEALSCPPKSKKSSTFQYIFKYIITEHMQGCSFKSVKWLKMHYILSSTIVEEKQLIKRKKRDFVSHKLTENISKPKELWKSLKKLGLPSKSGPPSNICLGEKDKVSFDNKENAETFKNFYENLASHLVDKITPVVEKIK